MSHKIGFSEVEAMRDSGKSLIDRGFFELDLMSSKVMWVNDFVLSKTELSLTQVRGMTVYDLVPEEFHDSLSSFMSDAAAGKTMKFYIWPNRCLDGSVVWWYFMKVRSDHPIHWFKAEFLNKTGMSGPEYASMCAAMNVSNSYNDLVNRINDLQYDTTSKFDSVDQRHEELRVQTENLSTQIIGATTAANKAANAAMSLASVVKNYQNDAQNQFDRMSTEIINLIATDSIHDKRLAAFEEHIKKTTDNAVRVITVQANKAGEIITTQADKAGKNLSKNVTIPIASIAAIMTILQWIITHWPK